MIDTMAVSAVGSATAAGRPKLSPEQQAQVAKLAARDKEVRAHEAQHMAAAGSLAVGGPQYTYQAGPDGKLYAVGGEVKMSFSSGANPEETLAKAERMRSAATAPADPSGQDMVVAARASQLEASAREEKRKQSLSATDVSSAAQLKARPQG